MPRGFVLGSEISQRQHWLVELSTTKPRFEGFFVSGFSEWFNLLSRWPPSLRPIPLLETWHFGSSNLAATSLRV